MMHNFVCAFVILAVLLLIVIFSETLNSMLLLIDVLVTISIAFIMEEILLEDSPLDEKIILSCVTSGIASFAVVWIARANLQNHF